MKALGIGLIILLIGIILVTYTAYVNYDWTNNPPETLEEAKDMQDQMETATTAGLVGNIIALIGVAIFIYEFMQHEHKS